MYDYRSVLPYRKGSVKIKVLSRCIPPLQKTVSKQYAFFFIYLMYSDANESGDIAVPNCDDMILQKRISPRSVVTFCMDTD